MQPHTIVVTAVSGSIVTSQPVVMDRFAVPTNISLGCIVSGTATYSVQHTFHNVGALGLSGAVWFTHPDLSSDTTNADGNYAYPVQAIRLVVLAGDSPSRVSLIVTQAGS